jgi:uncharacterized protein (TIGR03084 family)
MTQQKDVFRDLAVECDEIDKMVSGLDPTAWDAPTPAPGWAIKHQIAHLSFVFSLAGLAASDEDTFEAMTAPAKGDFNGAVNKALTLYPLDDPAALFARWQSERATSIEALARVPEGETVPWLVRPLPVAVLAGAGLMEAFAHGQDIADALGVDREPTERLRHLVAFAILTWDFGYASHGLTPPDAEFRWEITLPSGEVWSFGPADSPERITGPARDLALLVTRRRHRDDLAMRAEGEYAEQWLDIAQAYRGPAGEGREPGQFAGR